MSKEVEYKDYVPSGAAYELFTQAIHERDPEILIEGPAGTGKTRAVLEYVNWLCESYPGIRILVFRKTRTSMNESVLVTWEEKVLWDGHPAKVGDAHRNNRQHYHYPNGSHVVIGGMDNSDRIMSTEYDVAACFEATEISLEDWEKVQSRLRNNILDWQQGICDCNPGSQYHWLNQRANQGKMRRLLSRHEDNPTVTEAYLNTLRNLTGARYERLFKGRWVSEEGLVYDGWDPATHIMEPEDVPELKWHFGAVDWGFRAPGVFQVWGVDNNGAMYRVAEIYRTQKQIDWWAEAIWRLHNEYNLSAITCDPAEPRSIDMLNQRMGDPRGRDMPSLARKADNDIMAGTDQVRWAMDPGGDEPPLLYLVKGALREGRDPALAESFAPCCTEEEVTGYVWLKQDDGKPIKEKPDPACPDHGLDAMRYAAMFAWRKDLVAPSNGPAFPHGSLGQVLKHNEVF